MTFELALASIPEPWTLSHLIHLSPSSWQCTLIDSHYLVNATGDTAAEAVLNASASTMDDSNFQVLSWLSSASPSAPRITAAQLLSGLLRPKGQIRRRV